MHDKRCITTQHATMVLVFVPAPISLCFVTLDCGGQVDAFKCGVVWVARTILPPDLSTSQRELFVFASVKSRLGKGGDQRPKGG